MPRLRVEGLLGAFPKLVGSDKSGASKQHTFVETDSVRYVYLPLESSLYLLLVTNKGSNIVEDLDTLRLLSRVIPEQLGLGMPLTEDNVSAKAFELLFAIDEVVASGGYREEVTLHQVRVNLEMESHEEKLAEMIKASKMAEAKEASKRKALELKARARDEEKNRAAGGGPSRYGGYGGGGGGGGYVDEVRVPDRNRDSERDSGRGGSGGGGGGAGGGGGGGASKAADPKKGGATGGLKLGSKKTGGLSALASGAAAGVMAEEGIRDRDLDDFSGGGASATVAAAKAAAEAASADQATVVVEERVAVKLSRDGGVQSMEVKGTMTLTVADEAAARLKVITARGDDKAFQYQNHPNVNKALWASEGVVALKQSDRPFPTATPVGVLRWRYQNKDDDAAQVPLMLTCWPEESGGGNINVNLEYTLQADNMTLANVVITVPLGGDVVPNVKSCAGVWKHNTREHTLLWRIDTLNMDNASGTLEFTVKGKNVDAFFPVSVNFTSTDTLCPIDVTSVMPYEGDELRFSATKTLLVDEYQVE